MRCMMVASMASKVHQSQLRNHQAAHTEVGCNNQSWVPGTADFAVCRLVWCTSALHFLE